MKYHRNCDKMRIRSNIFPRKLRDWVLFMAVVLGVPFVYLVEISVVLPYFHGPESFMHTVHFFLAFFVVTNISSNFLAIIICDTSVPKDIMSSQPKPKWEFCPKCEKYAPPRSWHCKTCDVCILKRDHHCLFSGCCVGYNNMRYFVFFLIYMCLSCLYALIYNGIFLYYNLSFNTLGVVIQLFCPVCTWFIDTSPSVGNHYYIHTLSLIILGFSLSFVLLFHHLKMVLQGKVTHERDNDYNLGWRKNIEDALGKNWYLTWISPLVSSPLPHDGLEWTTTSEWAQKDEEKSAKTS